MDVKKLLETLKYLPLDFPLVPVNGKKKPLGYEWQYHPLTPEKMRSSLLMGGISVKNKKGRRITVWLPSEDRPPRDDEIGGFGILNGWPVTVGEKSFHLMSIDCDGKSAVKLLKKLSRSSRLPHTVAFSSGRPSRCQYLFLIPENIADTVRTRKISTGKDEQLEFRWKGLVSVLPPSIHPETGLYRWRRSIRSTEIAIAPAWAIQVMQGKLPISPSSERVKPTRAVRIPIQGSETQKAIALLEHIPPSFADDYWDWIKIGTALKTVSEELLPVWESWSQQSQKYKPGECEYKWGTFIPGAVTIGTLYYFAGMSR
jgi:hypothetical protein